MRSVGLVTVARSDYGIWQPVLKRLAQQPGIDFWLYVAGMHLEARYGMTVNMVEKDGYPIRARVPMLMKTNDPGGVTRSIGHGVEGFAKVFESGLPDILCVLGDRFDMIPAVIAAAPFQLPVAHVHGGEVTEGAMDELFRHAITKMAHLHFASTRVYANRIIQMGEEPWRVSVSGAPGLDHLRSSAMLSREQLAEWCGLDLTQDPVLVTYHPATLDDMPALEQIRQLMAALAQIDGPIVFTLPNADMGGLVILESIRSFIELKPHQAVLIENLGSKAYFSMMSIASVMVGNSSSGIIESASLKLPVVNVGNRQKGRERNANVIDCSCDAKSILEALKKALDPGFRSSIQGIKNVYGDGDAATRIVDVLAEDIPRKKLINKRWHFI